MLSKHKKEFAAADCQTHKLLTLTREQMFMDHRVSRTFILLLPNSSKGLFILF